MLFVKIMFWISVFIIFWANIGYPLSMLIIGRFVHKENKKNNNYKPSVTLMIVAHNEEKVIRSKLENAIKLDYPKEKFKILVSSDNSTDKTNDIVEEFIKINKDRDITLYQTKERKGKTNAQNEAARLVETEVLVMTDANSIIEKESIKEIVSSFSDDDIVYVTGRLCYTNSNKNETSNSENLYWDLDTKIREIESRLQTITAGNGALYACRTKDYYCFDPIKCHDSSMPLYYALNGKRAIANQNAIAYEKAGENIKDEFKRKVRMSRIALHSILPDIRILNIFKYKWFSYFYFGHRSCRYMLWSSHILLLISNILLCGNNTLYIYTLIGQVIIYLMATLKGLTKIDNKLLNVSYYYCATIIAQTIGVYNTITGKTKPFWEKAESTR
ncbi:MAG TPA: glycosyltransferase family 2 protein [Clostridiaceae bacterium]|nr:glycosyltransferase family 2 protein [Clostridiaceae bacterium]